MKTLLCSMAIASSMFCAAAYSQPSVLSCLIKTVSGDALTKPVSNLKVGTILDIPVDVLRKNGSQYEGSDLFNTEIMGEGTTIVISRETGEFELSAWSGGFLTGGNSKKVSGFCKNKKMKL